MNNNMNQNSQMNPNPQVNPGVQPMGGMPGPAPVQPQPGGMPGPTPVAPQPMGGMPGPAPVQPVPPMQPPVYNQPVQNGMMNNQPAGQKKNLVPIIAIVVVLVVVVGVVLYFFVFNGSKKLECSFDYGEDDGSMKQSVTYTFDKKGEKVKKANMTITIEAPADTTDEEFDSAYEELEKQCDTYKDSKAISCKVSKSGKKITESLTINVTKLSKEEAEEIDMDLEDIEDYKYDDAKKEMEDSGYTCK